MDTDQKLLDEILDSASKIPLEWQERVRDVVKAMVFTRSIMRKESGALPNRGSV